MFTGNRPSLSIMLPTLDAYTAGQVSEILLPSIISDASVFSSIAVIYIILFGLFVIKFVI